MNYEIPTIKTERLFYLTDQSIYCLSSMAFYEKMLKEKQNVEGVE